MDVSTPAKAYRVESYRSSGSTDQTHSPPLRSYFITQCQFVNAEPLGDQEVDIHQVSDQIFLKKATEHTLRIYSNVMRNVLQRTGPVIEMFQIQGSRECRLIIGYRQRSTKSFFSAMSDLYHYYDLYSARKFVGKNENQKNHICPFFLSSTLSLFFFFLSLSFFYFYLYVFIFTSYSIHFYYQFIFTIMNMFTLIFTYSFLLL